MILYSDVYLNQSLQLESDVITFVDGQCEVEDEKGKEILEMGYANISGSKEIQKVLPNEELVENHEHIVKSYEAEIFRLKGIIDAKDVTIKTLTADVEEWKKVAVEGGKIEYVEVVKEADPLEELKSLTKSNLIQLAMDKQFIVESKEFNNMNKDEIVNFIYEKLSQDK